MDTVGAKKGQVYVCSRLPHPLGKAKATYEAVQDDSRSWVFVRTFFSDESLQGACSSFVVICICDLASKLNST